MKIGFTGTRQGMTLEQKDTIFGYLRHPKVKEFHHGDCIGADAQAALMATRLGLFLVSYPCNLVSQRANVPANVVHQIAAPIERNHKIVNAVDLMLACPSSRVEVLRSGTWATIRYALKVGKRIYLIGPDGKEFKLGQ